MSDGPTERTLARLTEAHLARLSELARADHEKFFKRQPAFRGRCLAIVLAQGGAQHYIDGKNGVKDLDVWTFFSLPPGVRTFPAPSGTCTSTLGHPNSVANAMTCRPPRASLNVPGSGSGKPSPGDGSTS